MTGALKLTDDPAPHRRLAGRAGAAAAMGLLLACLCARTFIGEVFFRTSAIKHAHRPAAGGDAAEYERTVERTELARTTFAVLVLAAGAIWLLGRAVAGELKIRYAWLGALILAFAAWSLAAALNASDKRSALDGWIEQVALLAAFFLAAQLCADRRRFALVVVVLAALAMTMAAKGIWQVHVEIPDRVAEFQSNRAKYLGQEGIMPGTPEEKMFESRVVDNSPTGFGPLANVFASMLIVLLAAGAALAAEKLIAAAGPRKKWKAGRRRGEIHTPTLAAILTAAAAAPAAVILLLTHSRGGIVAGGLAAIAAVAVFLLRKRLARHRRKVLAAVAVVLLAAAAAVVIYGRKHDRLPTKTMTFRWFYWTATAEIVRDRPLLGVGPGNFASAYLQHRRLPGGEESVKSPHNAIADAAAQYGLPGAVFYLAVLAAALICASRPMQENSIAAGREGRKTWPFLVAFLAGSALASRAVFTEAGLNAGAFFLDAVVPAGALAICLLLARWTGGENGALRAGGATARIALGCGLAGFALHEMVNLALWTPATAMVFWVAAGACLGQAGGCRIRDLSKLRWPLAVAGVIAVPAALAILWLPVYYKTTDMESAMENLRNNNMRSAAMNASYAACTDWLDPVAAADTAKIMEAASMDGAWWASEAMRRDPAGASWPLLAARIVRERKKSGPAEAHDYDAIGLMRIAARLDPQDARLRLEYAQVLYEAGMRSECLEQLSEAERLDAALFADSGFRLSEAERQQIRALRKQAQLMRN